MEIDIKKIEELYGDDVIFEIKDNIETVTNNINYLQSKQILNTYEILNSYPYLLLEENDSFQEIIDNLIIKLGVDYIEILENDMSLWGDLI